MSRMVPCSGCGRLYRPDYKQRKFGSLGNFCTWACKSASAFRAKREKRRGE